jgi:hypothetical protein
MRRTVKRPVKNTVTPVRVIPRAKIVEATESKGLEAAIKDAAPVVAASASEALEEAVTALLDAGAQQTVQEAIQNDNAALTKVEQIIASTPPPVSDSLSPSTDFLFTLYAHRSGHETFWACPFRYYLNYQHCGTGIVRTPTKIQLTVGSAVHIGLGVILEMHKISGGQGDKSDLVTACKSALAYFLLSDTFRVLKDDERSEQCTLIVGLLASFWYYRWPSFKEQFEVLTVEQDWVEEHVDDVFVVEDNKPRQRVRAVVSSRPDAIVRDRKTNEIVVISWKTCDEIADYKRVNYHNNLQVALEAHYGNKVLSRYMDEEYVPHVPENLRGKARMEYMAKQVEEFRNVPRQVDYTLTIFLVKGARTAKLLDGEDINLEDADNYEDAAKVYKQQSFLCYVWNNVGESHLGARAWTQRYYKEGNTSYNNAGKDFVSEPSVPPATPLMLADPTHEDWDAFCDDVFNWVEALNDGQVFPSTLPDTRNLANPLKRVIVDDEPEYANHERYAVTRDVFVRQSLVNAEKMAVLQSELIACATPSEAENAIRNRFDKHLISCNNAAPQAGVPVRCEYKGMCHGEDGLVQIAPAKVTEGVWTRRLPHHNVEREAFGLA